MDELLEKTKVIVPTIVGDEFEYKGFQIEMSLSKQCFGVFCTEDVPVGTALLYGGVELSTSQANNNLRAFSRGKTHVNIDYLADTRYGYYLDANPTLYPPSSPTGGWIGSKINEASHGETTNTMFWSYFKGVCSIDKAIKRCH